MKRTLYAALLVLAVLTTAQSQTAKQPPKSSVETQPKKAVQTVRQRAAQAEMEKAQDACDEDRLADAEQYAKRASELDPSNKAALIFIAQVISRQYNRMEDGAEKTARAREAIAAYQRVADADPDNDEAYYAVRETYGEINEAELQRSWDMQRAINAALSAEKRADAYTTLAQWEDICANDIITQTREKLYSEESGKFELARLDAESREELSVGRQCVSRGLQMVELAIAIAPEDAIAWRCKAGLLSSAAGLYEFEGDEAQDEQYSMQSDETLRHASELEAKRKEAEEARVSRSRLKAY
jgi:hypothetical protein